MALRLCRVSGCDNYVREGLRRRGTGASGQELADGETCWRCRQKQVRQERLRTEQVQPRK